MNIHMNELHGASICDSTHQGNTNNEAKYGNVKPHNWKGNYTTM
jgi:hypothetical protein